MPTNGKKSLTLYSPTIKALGEMKKYGETWDRFLLDLLDKSGRAKSKSQEGSEIVNNNEGKGESENNV